MTVGDGGVSLGMLTPGHLMGIPLQPETASEHVARLGHDAATGSDVGWLTGTQQGYTLDEPHPTIDSFQPQPLSPSFGAETPAGIYGTHFDATVEVTVDGAPVGSLVVDSPTQLSFTVDCTGLTPGTPALVVVSRGDMESLPFAVDVVATAAREEAPPARTEGAKVKKA